MVPLYPVRCVRWSVPSATLTSTEPSGRAGSPSRCCRWSGASRGAPPAIVLRPAPPAESSRAASRGPTLGRDHTSGTDPRGQVVQPEVDHGHRWSCSRSRRRGLSSARSGTCRPTRPSSWSVRLSLEIVGHNGACPREGPCERQGPPSARRLRSMISRETSSIVPTLATTARTAMSISLTRRLKRPFRNKPEPGPSRSHGRYTT